MPSIPPPYDSVSGPVAASGDAWPAAQSFILALRWRVGTTPCRYACPYAGLYGLATDDAPPPWVARDAADARGEAASMTPVARVRDAAPASAPRVTLRIKGLP